MSIEVKTTGGIVRGIEEEGINFFNGIPYAETLRFQDPKPYHWDDILDVSNNEIDCYPAYGYPFESSFYASEFKDEKIEKKYQESPMTLSIVAPSSAKKLPVFIFIHGGAFDLGSISDPPYAKTTEYAKRGIIFVTIGYRLNVFGLYKGKNLLLKDQDFAIRWVYENIEAFGGDKNQIIIGGQSAGAMSVMDLIITPRLEGIVKGAILMSGAGPIPKFVGPKPASKTEKFWHKFMLELGCQNENELLKIEPEKMVETYEKLKKKGIPLFLQEPAVDGVILPYDHSWLIKHNLELNIPVIAGITGQDMMPIFIHMILMSWAKERIRKNLKPIYAYFFNRIPPNCEYKAYHAVDLWYAFGNLEKRAKGFDSLDYEIKDMMIDYFANFIKSLDPNGEGLPRFEPLSKNNGNMRLIEDIEERTITPSKVRKIHFKVLIKDKGPI